MRVQCDVCVNAEAAVMCCADEAALCVDCDVKVHAANKLATKHQRVQLLKDLDSPRCDICQEKTGYFFCLQDRALLCRNCDVSIHTANSLSSSHQRFLVTGVKASLEAINKKEHSVGSSEKSLKDVTCNISSPIANSWKASCPSFSAPNLYNVSRTCGKTSAANIVSPNIPSPSTPSVFSGVFSTATMTSSVSDMSSMPATPSSASDTHMFIEPNSLSHGYRNIFKQNRISEFLTDAIPGWRVDELLNIPDLAGGYTLGDVSSSKADTENLEEFDWTADLSLFDEQVCADSFHEVPEMLLCACPFIRPGRLVANSTKEKAKQDMENASELEEAFTVPDLGLIFCTDFLPSVKRRRV